MPIKSADKFEYEQSKGTLYLAKRPLLKNSPLGCFINSQHCLKGKKQCTIALKIAIALVNAPFRQGISLIAMSDQRLCLWKPPAFLKNCWTKKLLDLKFQKTFSTNWVATYGRHLILFPVLQLGKKCIKLFSSFIIR